MDLGSLHGAIVQFQEIKSRSWHASEPIMSTVEVFNLGNDPKHYVGTGLNLEFSTRQGSFTSR